MKELVTALAEERRQRKAEKTELEAEVKRVMELCKSTTDAYISLLKSQAGDED